MTLSDISPEVRITAFLKSHLTDYNSADRVSAEWIYESKPAILDMLNDKDNFPVVTVGALGSNNSVPLAIDCTDFEDTINMVINVWTIKNMVLDVFTQTGFSWTSGTDITPTIIPIDKISQVSVTRSGATEDITDTCILVDSDGDGLYDLVRMADATGVSAILTCNTARVAEGKELARVIALDAHKALRNYWADELSPTFFNYRRTGFISIDFDAHIGLYRHELQIELSGINIGED